MITQNTQTLDLEKREKTPLFYKLVVIASLISLIAGSLTGIMTFINLGYTETFFSSWLRSFVMAALIMAPSGLIFSTLIKKVVGWLMQKASDRTQNLITGLLMALVMESIMATITTSNAVGLSDTALFLENWGSVFMGALPIGLMVGLTMTMAIKPRLDKFMAS